MHCMMYHVEKFMTLHWIVQFIQQSLEKYDDMMTSMTTIHCDLCMILHCDIFTVLMVITCVLIYAISYKRKRTHCFRCNTKWFIYSSCDTIELSPSPAESTKPDDIAEFYQKCLLHDYISINPSISNAIHCPSAIGWETVQVFKRSCYFWLDSFQKTFVTPDRSLEQKTKL